jgi:DNA-binding NarL/FixJ family response regulator
MKGTITRLRVMLVDDHAVVRTGYRRLLEDEPDLLVVAEHGDADAAYAALIGQTEAAADVMVLDLSMPGRSGLDLLRRARMRWPALRVLVFSMHDSPVMVAQALKAGAAGFITKSSEPAVLVNALRRVGCGETGVLSLDLAQSLDSAAALPPHRALSGREFDVLRGIVEGLTLDQIAARLHLSSKTVSNYQTQIRQRLGVATAVELLHYAREHRLFVP